MNWILPLLANSELQISVERYTRRSASIVQNWHLIVGGLVVAAFWVGLYCWDMKRRKSSSRKGTPKSLFIELCQAHGLDRAERNLAWKVAESRSLKQPALVFVDQDLIGRFGQSHAGEAKECNQLANKLFG